jgi:proline racemase
VKRTTFVDAVYTQTEGETTCIINGQFVFPANTDILQKREYFKSNFDWMREAIIREPRGHNDLFGAIIVPSSTPDADVGIIWIDGGGYGDMCGHGTIATSMVLTAFDMVPHRNANDRLRIETPAGIVSSEVSVSGDQVEWCRFQNVPGFLAEKDVTVTLPDLGEVKADIAFGGNYFVTIPMPLETCRIAPENGGYLARLGMIAKKQINEKITLAHPEKPHITEIDLVTFYQPSEREGTLYRCVHTYRNGKMDRSPGGTGTSAMLAMLEARGRIKLGEPVRAEGLLGTGTFEGCLIGETKVAGNRAVIPTIKGRSNIIGFAKWFLDPNDPVGRGYVVDNLQKF